MLLDILEIPEIKQKIVPLSLQDYESLCLSEPEKYKNTELYRGMVIEKMTKSSRHNYYKNVFTEQLRSITPNLYFVQNENSISIRDSDLEPDISIILGKQKDYIDTKPTTARLVVEISVSSVAYDRSKALDYAKANVEEYWIVVIESETVEVYKEPSESGYGNKLILNESDSITIFENKIDLSKIFD